MGDFFKSAVQIMSTLEERKEKQGQSARHNIGKTQLREVDPDFIMGLGEVLTASRKKYDEFNWAKPTKLSTPYESAMRHLMAFQKGENIDPDDNLSHLLKAAVNIMFMHYHITNNPEYSDDRFFKKDKK
jgi:hypothetical protein